LSNTTSNSTVKPGTTATDTFTLTNGAGQPGTFNAPAAATILGPAGSIVPSGYTLNGGTTVYPTTPSLQAALAALAPTPSGASITVGVQYVVPTGYLGHTIGDTFVATLESGGVTSAPVSTTANDTINAPTQLSNTTSNSTVKPGTTATDTFTLTNGAGQPGTFNAPAAATILGPAGSIVPSGYTLNGGMTVYPTTATLQAALAALTPTPSGASITIGVQYVVPTGYLGQTISDTFAATLQSGGVTSAPASSTANDTINAQLSNTTSNNTVNAGTTATDTFTLTNVSGQPGTFNAPAAATILGPAGPIVPSGYILNGGTTVYPTPPLRM
jgi:hypothetical protein